MFFQKHLHLFNFLLFMLKEAAEKFLNAKPLPLKNYEIKVDSNLFNSL